MELLFLLSKNKRVLLLCYHKFTNAAPAVYTFDSIRMYGVAARFLGNVNYNEDGEEVSTDDDA